MMNLIRSGKKMNDSRHGTGNWINITTTKKNTTIHMVVEWVNEREEWVNERTNDLYIYITIYTKWRNG